MSGYYSIYNLYICFSNTFETARYNMIIHVIVFLVLFGHVSLFTNYLGNYLSKRLVWHTVKVYGEELMSTWNKYDSIMPVYPFLAILLSLFPLVTTIWLGA